MTLKKNNRKNDSKIANGQDFFLTDLRISQQACEIVTHSDEQFEGRRRTSWKKQEASGPSHQHLTLVLPDFDEQIKEQYRLACQQEIRRPFARYNRNAREKMPSLQQDPWYRMTEMPGSNDGISSEGWALTCYVPALINSGHYAPWRKLCTSYHQPQEIPRGKMSVWMKILTRTHRYELEWLWSVWILRSQGRIDGNR